MFSLSFKAILASQSTKTTQTNLNHKSIQKNPDNLNARQQILTASYPCLRNFDGSYFKYTPHIRVCI